MPERLASKNLRVIVIANVKRKRWALLFNMRDLESWGYETW